MICDTELLATLPPREWASGRGEMAKYAFLGGSPTAGGGPDASLLELPLDEQVARCVAIKAEVVAADEREGDRRMVLNYGHTLAHALEAAAFEPGTGLDLRHGEAVAVGLVYAALLARRLGRIDDGRVELHRRVVGAFDLSAALPAGVEPERLVSFMARDKKAPTTSPSCWTARGGSRWPAGWTRPTCWLPLRRCTARNQVARGEHRRHHPVAVRAQPQPAGGA